MIRSLIISTYLICFVLLSEQQPWLPIRIEFKFLKDYPAEKVKEINIMTEIVKQFYGNSLLVQRLPYKLRFADSGLKDCSGIKIPTAIRSLKFDADIVDNILINQVFFVVLMKSQDDLAYSAVCAQLQDSQSVFNVLGLGPELYNKQNLQTLQFNSNLGTIIHEVMHGLGFDNELFNKFTDSYTYKLHPVRTFRKNKVLYLATPRVLQYTREYFGCENAIGVPMEDQEGVGSKDTHWERRLFYNELMIADDHIGDNLLSIFSFKLLEDSGWYKLGDISVDPITFGKNKGCNFIYKGCLGGSYPEFCDSQAIDTSLQCSWGSTGIGACFKDSCSNTCKLVQLYYNEDCRDPNELTKKFAGQLLKEDYQTMQTFSYDSRCFNTTFTNQSKGDGLLNRQCHKFSCSNDSSSLQISIGNETLNCTQNGQKLTSSTYHGTMHCPPDINQFCFQYAECPNDCNQRGFCVNKKCFCMKGFSGSGCEQTCSTYRTSAGDCVETCPAKTFTDNYTLTCLGCPFGCATCELVGKCSTCKDGYTLHHGSCENSYQFDTLIKGTYKVSHKFPKDKLIGNKMTTVNQSLSKLILESAQAGSHALKILLWIAINIILI